jgi:WD40 repeat protein
VYSVAFSPGGHTLASGGTDGTVRLWDVTDPAHPRRLGQPLTGAATPVVSVAFSPGGHTLASGSLDGTVRLWDVTDPAHPRRLGQPLAGSTAGVVSVAFSPGGDTLASGSIDSTMWLWNLNVQYAIQRICATAGGLTPQQWNQYVPQLAYQPSCAR